MRASKEEPIGRIVKLVEAVQYVSSRLALVAAMPITGDSPLRNITERLHEMLLRFDFELKLELSRIGGQIAANPDPSNSDLCAALDLMLDTYQQALATRLTAHTRAMITRQLEELQRTCREFASAYQMA